MTKILTIMWKEIRDNIRDRRSLFFALIYGPIFMPAMMFGPMVFIAKDRIQTYEEPTTIYIYGEELAPNLINHLHQENFNTKTAPANFKAQIKNEIPLENEDMQLVLEISETYPTRFTQGLPARVTLYYDNEDNKSQAVFYKARSSLYDYRNSIASGRMMIRGLDQRLLRAIDIVENDVSEKDEVASNIANMVLFMVLFSMMMGGFYLAIDTTAGERERLSLEPLLSLAMSRFQITAGKYLAVLVFVILSFLMPIISAAIWISYLPEDLFGYADTPTLMTFIKMGILISPLCLLITGFLMVVAALAKSPKEAQTQMGFAMLFPMAPFFAMMFMDIKLTSITSLAPMLSQFLIANEILKNSLYPLSFMIPGMLTTLGISVAFFVALVYIYRRESMLG